MASLSQALRDLLADVAKTTDEDISIGEAALALCAAVRGNADIATPKRHLQSLADDVAKYLSGAEETAALRAEALAYVMFQQYGYSPEREVPDDHDDAPGPDGACLMAAMEQRHASGLALGVLALHTARTLGWAVDALDFPGRFLLRLEHHGERLITDPLARGHAVDAPTLRALLKEIQGADAELTPHRLRPLNNGALLYRYHTDFKMRLLRQGRLEDALALVNAMLLAAPQAAALWREAGMINVRLDDVPAAVTALEHYLTIADEDEARYKASQMLHALRDRLL